MTKRIRKCWIGVALMGSLGALVLAPLAAAKEKFTAIKNVNVISMDAPRLLVDQTVLLHGERIVVMGDAATVAVPDHARRIDGRGKYLMPGLADMHAHIRGEAAPGSRYPAESIARNQLLLYAATGVTLIRDAAGTPAHFKYDALTADGSWVGPDLFVASPIIEGRRNVWDASKQVTNPELARDLVAEYAAQGYWGIKVYHTVSREVYEAIIEAAAERALPVMGHVPFDVGIDEALDSRQSSVEHLRGYDFDGVPIASLWADGGRSRLRFGSWGRMTEPRRKELIDKTVSNGVWNVPTLAVNRLLFDVERRAAVASNDRFSRVHPALRGEMTNAGIFDAIFSAESKQALREAYPLMLDFIQALHIAGAGLLVGTDSTVPGYVPGFTVIDELQNFVDAGLSTFSALSAATTAPAQYLGVLNERGTVAAGKRADLILLRENPLEEISALWSLDGVFLAGRWHSLESMESALDASVKTGAEP